MVSLFSFSKENLNALPTYLVMLYTYFEGLENFHLFLLGLCGLWGIIIYALKTYSCISYHFNSAEFDDSFGNLDAFKETGSRKRYVGAYVHLLRVTIELLCIGSVVIVGKYLLCCPSLYTVVFFMFQFLLNDSMPG